MATNSYSNIFLISVIRFETEVFSSCDDDFIKDPVVAKGVHRECQGGGGKDV